MIIKSLKARQILDSRGNPTVEVDLKTAKGMVRASVPSGASTGVHEAKELRDGGLKYDGKGVLKAVKNVDKIANSLKNKNFGNQFDFDQHLIRLDGTSNKSKLGANAILACSLAFSKAKALEANQPLFRYFSRLTRQKPKLPIPAFNIINGGKHAGGKLAFQEYMLWPKAKTFSERLRIGSEIYHELKGVIKKKYGVSAVNVGDEGGFAPPMNNVEEPIKLILKAAKELGYEKKISIGLDAAASEFFTKTKYFVDGKLMTTNALLKKYESLSKMYPLVSIEDPFEQEAFPDFAALLKKIKRKTQIVGDDLLVTNIDRVTKAIRYKACNALLLKVNQIGTITETLNAASLAMHQGWNVMVSHRSGETTDNYIADLAVGLGCGQLKSGAPCRGERTAKYNQLLRIEEEL